MFKFREHRGGYDDAMRTVIELADHPALVKHVRSLLSSFNLGFYSSGEVHVTKYGYGIDPRNGWDTHIVTLDRYGVMGFTDGPVHNPEGGNGLEGENPGDGDG